MTATNLDLASDITTCDREPIHIPGSIQPHGFLIALDVKTRQVRQISANVASVFDRPSETLLQQSFDLLVGKAIASEILQAATNVEVDRRATYLLKATMLLRGEPQVFTVIGHRNDGLLILEFEPSTVDESVSFRGLQALVESFIFKLANAGNVRELSQLAAEETRRITGFDRVLIYKFDAEYHGIVLAEDRNDRLPSYLDLRFPASDIPRQARELYRSNRIRIIADAAYQRVPLVPANNPVTGKPTDLSFSVLRSVSPIHVEYMKNMGMYASMSISIMRDNQLWGLISCHHKTSKTVPFEARTACDFLGQVFGLQLTAKEQSTNFAYRVELKSVLSRLLARMAANDNFVDGLIDTPSELLELGAASGAAVVTDQACARVGTTPPESVVRKIAAWLTATPGRDVFSTTNLSAEFADAAEYQDIASGLMAISISKRHPSYIVWFRPEVVQTVNWGGDPRKAVEADGMRLHPRKSFELWKETVRSRSLPWNPAELETATELRNVILGIVLQKAEEMADLTRELERSNKELEAFSYSVSHDLRAPFRHIVGYSELLREMKGEQLDDEGKRYIKTIIDSALFAGTLVDNLLAFSQMGRSSLNLMDLNMNRLVAEVRADVQSEAGNRKIEWRIAELPTVWADPIMMKLAVRNLLSNAVKYTRGREAASIEIGCTKDADRHVFHVKDNGVGFDMKYVDKLFGVFQRLHRMEEFEGTGIGLANVRRIINRHGGDAWAIGEIGRGATFSFSLPDHREAGAS